MTQQEFFNRTALKLSSKEYAAVEELYYSSELDKDEFCKEFKKFYTATHRKQIEAQKAEEKARKEREQIIEKLHIIELKLRNHKCTSHAAFYLTEKDIEFCHTQNIVVNDYQWCRFCFEV